MSGYLLNLSFINPYYCIERNIPNVSPTPAHIFINILVLNRFIRYLFFFGLNISIDIHRSVSWLLSSKLQRQVDYVVIDQGMAYGARFSPSAWNFSCCHYHMSQLVRGRSFHERKEPWIELISHLFLVLRLRMRATRGLLSLPYVTATLCLSKQWDSNTLWLRNDPSKTSKLSVSPFKATTS
jgi:hypothetical protein